MVAQEELVNTILKTGFHGRASILDKIIKHMV
jgi:hypothetical protein